MLCGLTAVDEHPNGRLGGRGHLQQRRGREAVPGGPTRPGSEGEETHGTGGNGLPAEADERALSGVLHLGAIADAVVEEAADLLHF